MISTLQALTLAFLGNSAIYAGLAFVNATLLPKLLAETYQQTTIWQRVIVMSVLSAPLANFAFSRVYKLVDAANAGMLILGSLIIVLVAKALLVEGGALTVRAALATLALIGAAVWVSYELHNSVP